MSRNAVKVAKIGDVGGDRTLPLYEYECPECGRFELIQRFSDQQLSVCPTCGQAVQKLPSAPAFQFKGTGWYVTDYARKAPEKSKEAPKSKDASAETASSKAGTSAESTAPTGSTKPSTTDAK
jgi:putative FmdB family regulatory protein